MFNSLNYNEAQRRFRLPCLSFPLYFPFWVFTLIYSVQCCFKRPLCPGVGIITGLPLGLIEPEPAITSVLLEYACKHSLADSSTASPCFDSVISISEYEATVSSCLSNTVGAQQKSRKMLSPDTQWCWERHFDAFELYFMQAMCYFFVSQRIVYTESRCTQRHLQYDKC